MRFEQFRRALFATVGIKFLAVFCVLLVFAFAGPAPMALGDEAQKEYGEQMRKYDEYLKIWDGFDQKPGKESGPNFCAVAYSKSTSKWGYSFGKSSLDEAKRVAIDGCGEQDAEILTWSKGSWYCALADGPDSYGADCAATAAEAKVKALKIGNDVAPGCRIVLVVGGRPPVVERFDQGAQPTHNLENQLFQMLSEPMHRH